MSAATVKRDFYCDALMLGPEFIRAFPAPDTQLAAIERVDAEDDSKSSVSG